MERDLVLQAESFLLETFQDKLDAGEITSLENWLSMQLEKERQGWKKQLHKSMKEIEKERRQAMDVHDCVQILNAKLREKMEQRGLERNHSIYYGDDRDEKTSQIATLEQNVDSILQSLELTRNELQSGLEYCNWSDGSSIIDAINYKLEYYKEQVTETARASRETEERLLKEIEHLSNNARQLQSANEQDQKRHARETLALQEIVSLQRDKLNNRDDARRWIRFAEKAVQTNRREMGGLRECCIQVDIPQPLNSKRTSPNPYMEQGDPGEFPQPITAIVLHQYGSPTTEIKQDSGKADQILETASDAHHAKPGKQVYSRHSNKLYSKRLSNNQESKQAIEDLRNQVVGFAEKLEKAKREMEIYQHQMALIKTSRSGSKSQTAKPPVSERATKDCLCGVKKNILPAIDEVENPLPPGLKLTKYTGKCLRCHKVYKIKENHRLACMYHPKAKQTVEKYDGNGKLLKITHLWECCLQKAEAPGCCTGAHV